MKKYSLITIILLATASGGCDNFLSHEPDDRQEINTVDKVQQTITGAYTNYGFRFTDMSSDNVGRVTGYASTEVILEDLYLWRRRFTDPEHQDAPGAYWRSAYTGIAQINIALEALKKLLPSAQETEKAGAARAEALILRSYYHFMLVNLFAPHYDPAVSASVPGVPYVTDVEDQLIRHYERNTVEEVYQLAETDLKNGLELMEKHKTAFSANKYRFTVPTAYLYASRFYQWRNKDTGDTEASLHFAQKAITAFGGTSVMRKWAEYKNDNKGPVDITQAEVGMVQSCATWTPIPSCYQLTTVIKNRYLTNPFNLTDERLETFFQYQGNQFIPAFYYVIDSDGSSTVTDLFPLSEAILNAAEALARLGKLQEALGYVKIVGNNVYTSKDVTANYDGMCTLKNLPALMGILGDTDEVRQEALIRYILFERRLQFLFHGMRWFDIRRYKLEVEHELLNGDIIYLSDYVPNRDYEIPTFAIEAGMTPND